MPSLAAHRAVIGPSRFGKLAVDRLRFRGFSVILVRCFVIYFPFVYLVTVRG
jgi:hypothetical protein